MNKAMSYLLATALIVLAPGGSGTLAGEAVGATLNGDVNCSGRVDLADAIFSLNHLFLGGEAPCPFIEPVGGGPEVEALEAQLAEREATIAALRAELTQAQVELSRSLGDLIRTQRDLLAAEARVLELEAAAGPCGEEVEELRSSLETCTVELEASGTELEAAQQEAADARQQTEAAQAETANFAALLDECENPREEFTAPALQGEEGQRVAVLSDKIDLLKSILPTSVEAVLAEQAASTIVLGRIPAAGSGERVLVYETTTRSVCSVGLCEAGDCEGAELVKLHYSDVGTAEAFEEMDVGEPFPVFSQTVSPIKVTVSRGPGQQRDEWTLVYDTRSKSIVGLRVQEGYRPVPEGAWPDHPDFGRGNGLVMSVVISGAELRSQLGLANAPRITRLVDLGFGQILVFFAREVLQEVHLLELEAFQSTTWKLRGEILRFGADEDPYLRFSEIRELTQEADAIIDGFQPFVNPADDSTVIFDSESNQFLKVTSTGPDGQGRPAILFGRETLDNLLGARGTFEFSSAMMRDNGRGFLLFEERSNILLAFDNTLPEGEDSLSLLVDAEAITSGRIDPSEGCGAEEEVEDPGVEVEGDGQGQGIEDPYLRFSGQGTLEHRLVFDVRNEELLALNLLTGRVIVIARSEELRAATGSAELDLTAVLNVGTEEEGVQGIRVWDNASSSLLEMDLESILAELCQ